MSQQPHSFAPAQAYPASAELSAELTGDSTDQVAEEILTLLPGFGPRSHVLDNGSRGGFMSEKIMHAAPPADLLITSVDPDPSMVAMAERRGTSEGWPQKTFVMAPESLSFPDDHFTHSFTNFLLPYTSNGGVDAARQIHRTLRPGATAVVSTWAALPHQAPLQAAHTQTRTVDAVLPLGVPEQWYQASHVEDVLVAGGFSRGSITSSALEAQLEIPDIRRWVTIAWSLLGAPAGGWGRADEDHWDHAIAVMLAAVHESPGFRSTGGDGMVMSLSANVAIAHRGTLPSPRHEAAVLPTVNSRPTRGGV